jgi:hypothetical protein
MQPFSKSSVVMMRAPAGRANNVRLGVSVMALIRKMRSEAHEIESVACVTAICALAGLPLAVCAAVTIFG